MLVARVSLSDWLALRARVRGGGKNPRLLRDRPTDGAALAARIHAGQVMAVFDRFFRITLLSCDVTVQEGSVGHSY